MAQICSYGKHLQTHQEYRDTYVATMEEIGATNPKYQPLRLSLMAPVRAPTLEKPSPGTHSLVYKTNSTFIVLTIIDLRFFVINHTH